MARQTPKVNFTLPEVLDRRPQWELVRDCLKGEQHIKKQRTKYLPMPDNDDKDRYEAYLLRARFYNVLARTLYGMLGEVLRKDPVITLPTLLAPMLKDVDGKGTTFEQQAALALAYALSFARGFLFVDYPKVQNGRQTSRQDLLTGQIHANILLLNPDDVINWRIAKVGAKSIATLVVIEERYTVADDGFEETSDLQWRALRLLDGIYHQQVWRKIKDTDDDYECVEDLTPLNSAGKPLNYIPCVPFGITDNGWKTGDPPLYDIATLNIGHYCNSADYEEACFVAGQPTFAFAGLTEEWVKNVMDNEVRVGSRGGIFLPVGGSASLLQPTANPLPKEAMDQKERQMQALGAKMVEQAQVQRTATEASIEEAGELSVLTKAARNANSAYDTALVFVSDFMGTQGQEATLELNTSLAVTALSAQDRAQLMAEWQGGGLTFEEYRWNLSRAGIAYLTDEEAKDQLESEALLATPAVPTQQDQTGTVDQVPQN